MSKISPAKSLFSLTALAVAVFCASNAATGATADMLLRFKFKVGDELDYEWCESENRSVTVEGETKSQDTTKFFLFSVKVKAVDANGKATVEVKVNRVKISEKYDTGETMEFDSAKGMQQGETAKTIDLIYRLNNAYKPIKTKIDALGNFRYVKLPDEPGVSIGGMLDVIIFPKKAVAPGKTWSTPPDIQYYGMGKQTFKYVGTEAKDGKDLEKIELMPKIILTPDEGTVSGRSRITRKKQEIKGDILFDNKAGRLHSAKTIYKSTFDQEWMGETRTTSNEITTEIKVLPKTGDK